MSEDKERRRYALLQAAAVIYAAGQRWPVEVQYMSNGHSFESAVNEASGLLTEIERLESTLEGRTSKSTPGPWGLEDCSNGGMLVTRPPLPGQKHAMQSHLQVIPVEDASLIASAPDLLEACRKFKDAIDAGTILADSKGNVFEFVNLLNTVNAAILKAEGRRDHQMKRTHQDDAERELQAEGERYGNRP